MFDSQSPQTTKYRIMDAAEQIVAEQGAAHLTFDALVKQTGISKGGILYHYPSKKALLQNMVARMIDDFEDARRHLEKRVQPTGVVNAKTYVLAMFEADNARQTSNAALMAAAANDPELLGIVREHYKRNFAELRALGDQSPLATLIFMALDAVWLLDSFKLCMMTDEEREAFKNMLLGLAEGKNILNLKEEQK